jgi:hypothetical protein
MIDDLNKAGIPVDSPKVDLYVKAFGISHQADFDYAAGIRGLDAEITMLRVEISTLIEHNPYNVKPIQIALLTLERLVRTRYQVSKHDEQELAERMANILSNIVLPAGISSASLKK